MSVFRDMYPVFSRLVRSTNVFRYLGIFMLDDDMYINGETPGCKFKCIRRQSNRISHVRSLSSTTKYERGPGYSSSPSRT